MHIYVILSVSYRDGDDDDDDDDENFNTIRLDIWFAVLDGYLLESIVYFTVQSALPWDFIIVWLFCKS